MQQAPPHGFYPQTQRQAFSGQMSSQVPIQGHSQFLLQGQNQFFGGANAQGFTGVKQFSRIQGPGGMSGHQAMFQGYQQQQQMSQQQMKQQQQQVSAMSMYIV